MTDDDSRSYKPMYFVTKTVSSESLVLLDSLVQQLAAAVFASLIIQDVLGGTLELAVGVQSKGSVSDCRWHSSLGRNDHWKSVCGCVVCLFGS